MFHVTTVGGEKIIWNHQLLLKQLLLNTKEMVNAIYVSIALVKARGVLMPSYNGDKEDQPKHLGNQYLGS